jgi:hypothetical protein
MHKKFRHYDWGGGIIQLNIFLHLQFQLVKMPIQSGIFVAQKNQGSTQRADPFLIY